MINLENYKEIIKESKPLREIGQVSQIIGLVIETDGPSSSIGDLCYIYTDRNPEPVWAEVVEKTTLILSTLRWEQYKGTKRGKVITNNSIP